jgi:hypothetical protein
LSLFVSLNCEKSLYSLACLLKIFYFRQKGVSLALKSSSCSNAIIYRHSTATINCCHNWQQLVPHKVSYNIPFNIEKRVLNIKVDLMVNALAPTCNQLAPTGTNWCTIWRTKLASTGTNWPYQLVQSGTNWHQLAPSGTNWHQLAHHLAHQTGTNLHQLATNGNNWQQLALTGTNWH